jgi:hypothetical protein
MLLFIVFLPNMIIINSDVNKIKQYMSMNHIYILYWSVFIQSFVSLLVCVFFFIYLLNAHFFSLLYIRYDILSFAVVIDVVFFFDTFSSNISIQYKY